MRKKILILLSASMFLFLNTTAKAIAPEMVFIPGGEFEMGDHHDGMSISLPVHSVYVDSFYMSRYEITNQQYCDYLNSASSDGQIKVVGGVVYSSSDESNSYAYCDTHNSSMYSQIDYSGGCFSVRFKGGINMSNHPMVRVSWYGAVACCNYYGYRLPTEAEWEYAARGGDHSPYYRYPWGNTMDGSKANYWESSDPYETGTHPWTTPVGYYSDNGYGLYDVTGNVFEWCNDWYSETYYQECNDIGRVDNPEGPTSGTYRVLRGGSWGDSAAGCRVSYHGHNYPDRLDYYYGFRVARMAEQVEGWIAFVANQDGDNDIWAIRPDGTSLKQLTNLAGQEIGPQWSPDSTMIAYAKYAEGQIWLYEWCIGANRKIYDVVDFGGQYYYVWVSSWSPDGSKLLFMESVQGGTPRIAVINVDGTGKTVVPTESGYVSNPSWCLSSAAFVYERRNWSGHTSSNDLWIYDFAQSGDISDGNNIRLTDGASGESTTKFGADWTPSNNIVFTWGHNVAVIDPGESPNWTGPVSDPMDPSVIFLTNDASYPSIRYSQPSWSPDTSKIVYTDESAGKDADLWIMDAVPEGTRYRLVLGRMPDWGNPNPCGPVAYWPFDGDANDASGNGHDGTVVGATLCEDRCGNPGSTYCFDGDGDYIGVGAFAFGGCESFTVYAEFKSHSGTGNDAILSYTIGGAHVGEGWGGVFSILINTDCRLCAELQDNYGNNSGPVFSAEGVNYNDGQWHTVAFTRDKATETINLYVDGGFVDSTPDVTETTINLNHLRIGCVYDETTSPYWDGYEGTIDEVRIYNCALSENEIAELAIPCDPIEEILDFIEDSVEAGTLSGSGPGKSAKGRLGALINMIEAAGNLIEEGLIEDACWQL